MISVGVYKRTCCQAIDETKYSVQSNYFYGGCYENFNDQISRAQKEYLGLSIPSLWEVVLDTYDVMRQL